MEKMNMQSVQSSKLWLQAEFRRTVNSLPGMSAQCPIKMHNQKCFWSNTKSRFFVEVLKPWVELQFFLPENSGKKSSICTQIGWIQPIDLDL